MDILAHGMWAAAGAEVLGRKVAITRYDTLGIVIFALLPDLVHLLPVIGWVAFGGGTMRDLYEYVVATPAAEPVLPPIVKELTHHLHCIGHSAIVAGAVTLVVWRMRRNWLIPLLGWWLHIVIDVFTHSLDYYPSPVLYPITYRGFDGVAWNTPTFMALNYAFLAATWIWLWRTRSRRIVP
ncbi:MAG: metal-dependent hydrolase [Burkholderiales bacterium]|nr:metal-dependent hydrolase [Burkholderiales bacterium]